MIEVELVFSCRVGVVVRLDFEHRFVASDKDVDAVAPVVGRENIDDGIDHVGDLSLPGRGGKVRKLVWRDRGISRVGIGEIVFQAEDDFDGAPVGQDGFGIDELVDCGDRKRIGIGADTGGLLDEIALDDPCDRTGGPRIWCGSGRWRRKRIGEDPVIASKIHVGADPSHTGLGDDLVVNVGDLLVVAASELHVERRQGRGGRQGGTHYERGRCGGFPRRNGQQRTLLDFLRDRTLFWIASGEEDQ